MKNKIIIAFIIAAIIGVGYAFKDVLTYENLLRNYLLLNEGIKNNYALASLLFLGVYILAVAISMPGALYLTLLGGILFGALWGGILVVSGATLGATAIFMLAKHWLKPTFEPKITQYIGKFKEGFEKNASSYLLFLRLTPIFPFWLVNIAPAFFNVSPLIFIATTLFGIAPASFIFTTFASGLVEQVQADAIIAASCQTAACFPQFEVNNLFSRTTVLSLVGLGLLSLLPVLLKRLKS